MGEDPVKRLLVACEESQAVCTAFRERGYEAFSCDTEECSGGHPEWHIRADVLPVLGGHCTFRTQDGREHTQEGPWGMIIGFPPCTYITKASAVRMRVGGEIQTERYAKAMEAKAFFLAILEAECERVAVENPTPLSIVGLPEPDQAIHPWQFGHPYSKRTCLWLRGLPPLFPTDIYSWSEPYVNGGCKDAYGVYRRAQGRRERDPKTRSKTFPGIAAAMAKQWGEYLER